MPAPDAASAVIAVIPYAITVKEIYWGVSLVAATMAFHGVGILMMLRVSNALSRRIEAKSGLVWNLGVLIFAIWMLTAVHLMEITIWAIFFDWKGAFATPSICYYFALNAYTTLGSQYHLPDSLRLLEGCIAIAGMLTFAWSTGAVFPLLQDFQSRQMQRIRRKRKS